jgi:uncharacterized membrane protein
MPQDSAKRPHRHRAETLVCDVCRGRFAGQQVLPAALVRPNLAELIAARVPGWSEASHICRTCLNSFRIDYARAEMEQDRGALTALEEQVLRSLREGESLSENLNKTFDETRTLGELIADRVAEFGGSWRFIIIFFGTLAVWVTANSLVLLWRPFDPYPYILLNLVLSLLAAVQAPIIMMSQNRQEARDRLHAENDYKVNLRAELEIRGISDKVDQLIHQQWAHLLELQEMQMEMIREISGRERRAE